jgi:N-acetylglucosaminyl-diphospho-decaprenol L-rhamnosyltransferase
VVEGGPRTHIDHGRHDEHGHGDDDGAPQVTKGAVSVVIVAFRSADHLDACLASLAGDPAVGSVVVVDSGSPDVALLRPIVARHAAALNARLIELGVNVGFGAACNRGAAGSSHPVLLFANPDTEFAPGCAQRLADALLADHVSPSVARPAVAGPQVLNPDGSVYPSARSFPSLWRSAAHAFLGVIRPHNRFSAGYLTPDIPDWVSGTAMAVRREAFEQVGGFDESYFMYVEDVDLCWRLTKAGWSVLVVPEASVMHHIGGSSRHRPISMSVAHHRSLWRFACRSTTGPARLALPLVFFGLAARCALVTALRLVDKRPTAARHGSARKQGQDG